MFECIVMVSALIWELSSADTASRADLEIISVLELMFLETMPQASNEHQWEGEKEGKGERGEGGKRGGEEGKGGMRERYCERTLAPSPLDLPAP